jgi:hypothetical protein
MKITKPESVPPVAYERLDRLESALVALIALTQEGSKPEKLRAQWSPFPQHLLTLADFVEQVVKERPELKAY